MTKTVILHQNLFLISEELTRAALLPTGTTEITRATKQPIPVRIFAVCMIWKTEVEVTLASLQVEWRYKCSLRKKKLSYSPIF